MPIYTSEQLAKVGTGETAYSAETGKVYTFSDNKTYMFYGESEDITDVINRIVDERVNKAIQEANVPTEIKTDTYIVNQYVNLSSYQNISTMNGYTRENDANNNISNYLEYTEGIGYKVLKSGWYFVKMGTYIASVSAADINAYCLVNGNPLIECQAWSGSDGFLMGSRNNNSTSIFLKQGDIIYFLSSSSGSTASEKTNWNCIYPMF